MKYYDTLKISCNILLIVWHYIVIKKNTIPLAYKLLFDRICNEM